MKSTSVSPWLKSLGNLLKFHRAGEIIAIIDLQRGIPSKRESSTRADYVPALCTHRPSLLPIEWSGEVFGARLPAFHLVFFTGRLMKHSLYFKAKLTKPYHLEEGEVVTRYP